VMRGAFVTQQWSLDIPMMERVDIFHVDDMSPRKRRRWLHHYRECVKRQLLLNGGERIHLSKNPLFSGWMQSLIDTFPDARFAVMMRDPASCIPSVLKLVELNWRGRGWKREAYARSLDVLTDISFESFTHPRDVLLRNPQTPAVVVDYRELTTRPRDTVRAIYRALDLRYGEGFDTYLQQQEEREKSHKTHFEYSIDDYKLSRARIETELADFYTRHGWPREADAKEPRPVAADNS
ncbi:MAG: sulfotransferase, partial [Halioglobus sp.]|nr:sulfotransferase [Halioglobus sp.]